MRNVLVVPRWLAAGLLVVVSVCGVVADEPRGVPASEGINNFGRVSAALFRGAQPDESGIGQLQKLGVRTIINLRMANDVWPEEAEVARRSGLSYFNVPLHGLSAPSDAEVARVLALVATSPPPVFIHCEHGADRTGTIVACYRMAREGWTIEQAYTEAKRYGISFWQFGMRRFIRHYAPGAAERWVETFLRVAPVGRTDL